MNIFSISHMGIFFLTFSLGLYVFLLDTRDRTHRLFFLMASGQAIWSLLAVFVHTADSDESVWLWFRIAATPGIIFSSCFIPHFTLVLTGTLKRKWILFLLYLPPLAVHYRNWTSFFIFDEIVKVGGHWIFKPASYSIWMYYWVMLSIGWFIASLVLLFRWRKRAVTKRARNQATIVFYSFLFYLLISAGSDYLITPRINLPSLSPISLIFFLFGVGYAIIRYRFLSITHMTVSRDIVESMAVPVVLLDTELRVVKVNGKAESLLRKPSKQLYGRELSQFMDDHSQLQEGFDQLLQGNRDHVSCLIRIPGGEMRLVELKMSLVEDKPGEPLGALLVGQEVLGLNHFLKRFHISERESETIQHVLSGASNRKIAEHLDITERTVKAHLTNIYNKLGVGSKIELLKVLREYHVLPNP